MRKRYAYILAAAIALLPMLTSCRQELCYDHFPTASVELAWEYEWERDYGEYHLGSWDADYHTKPYHDLMPNKPEWVNMMTYFPNGTYDEHFMSPDGDKFQVDADRPCSMLFYNGDTEYIILSDVASVSEARATATTRSRASLSQVMERHPSSRITNPPDVLYAAYLDSVAGVKSHELRHLPVKMQPLVYTYVIIYEFDYGLERVALARGAIGGMAESVYLRDGSTSDETSIIIFDCGIMPYGCRAEVRSFGVPGFPDEYYGRKAVPAKAREYTLNLEVMLRSGDKVEFNYDISDQLARQPRGGIIKVTGLHIEADQQTYGAGFDVDVSGWDDDGDVIDLPMGGQTKK